MDSPCRWLDAVSRSANEIINYGKSISMLDNLLQLAENVEEYLEAWKGFGTEIGSLEEAQSVGSYMVRVLNKAHELVINASKDHQPSPGEFAEIIDDFERYATMMNRLMNRLIDNKSCKDSSLDLVKNLHDLNVKIENDCAFLKVKALACKPRSPEGILPVICGEDLGPPEVFLGLPGSYACVYTARWEREGLMVAVKEFGPGCQRHFEGELVRLKWQYLDSSHILKLLGRSDSSNEEKLFLILELMDQDLEMLNTSESQLPMTDLVEIIIQMAKGMRFLHSRNVIHRDLKPKNVLLKESGKETDNQHYLVKLGDFGNSRGDFRDYTLEGEGAEVFPGQDDDTTYQGTLNYMAPEMKKGVAKYTRSVDVYSFGVTCTNLLSEIRQPNLSLEKLFRQSMHEDHLHRPSFEVICEELWIVMRELLAKDSIPPPPKPLGDPKVEVVDGTIHVSFELTWLYCVTSWMRIFPDDGRALIIKTERSNGPKALKYQYTTSEDDDKVIEIIISVQYPRWRAIIDLHYTPPIVVEKMMEPRQGYAFGQ